MQERNLLIGTVVILLGLVIFAIYVNSKSDSLDENPVFPREIDFGEFKKGFKNSVNQKQEVVIRSGEDWAELWKEMFPTQINSDNDNFDEKMIVAVFSGQKPTGGYNVEITKIEENSDSIDVFVKETSPGVNCVVTLALTSPFIIAELEKSVKEVKFVFEEDVRNC